MLFTWSTKNLCIVFRSWRVTGPFSLLLSLLAIVVLAAGYEGVRRVTRRYELSHAQRLKAYSTAPVTASMCYFLYWVLFHSFIYIYVYCLILSFSSCRLETALTHSDNEVADSATYQHNQVDASSPLLVGRENRIAVQRRGRIIMAALYAVQVFYSFFIM